MAGETISVLMACYNGGSLIRHALDSALSQLDANDELVVQDGASTDGTVEVLAQYAAEDRRISFISESDTGQSDALNRALFRARGDYVLWLNADDIVLPGSIEALRTALASASGPHVIAGGHQTLRADGTVIGSYPAGRIDRTRLMRGRTWVFSGSMLISRELLISLGGFDEESHYCMDLDLLLSLSVIENLRVIYVPNMIGTLRWHEGSKSGGQHWRFLTDARRVRKRHYLTLKDRVYVLESTVKLAVEIATIKPRQTELYRRARGFVRKSG